MPCVAEFDIIDKFEKHKDYSLEYAPIDDINNAEMIMTKLLILIAKPYGRKKVVLVVSIAGFLILQDCVYCNNSLLQLKDKPLVVKLFFTNGIFLRAFGV